AAGAAGLVIRFFLECTGFGPESQCKAQKNPSPFPRERGQRVAKATRSRGDPFLPACAGQKFLPPGGCGSLLLLRPSQRACKRQTAAPAPLRLFRPLDAPQLRSPWGQNGARNRALAARRLAHSQRSISLYVSRPSAHVGWTGLFCSLGELFVVLQGRISGRPLPPRRPPRPPGGPHGGPAPGAGWPGPWPTRRRSCTG